MASADGVDARGVAESGEEAGVPAWLDGAVTEGVPGVVEGFDFLEGPRVVAAVAGRLPSPAASVSVGVCSCLCESMAVDESEDVGGVADDEVPAVLFVEDVEPSEVPVSAWAIPEPLAKAAPKPRVTAPAPSQP